MSLRKGWISVVDIAGVITLTSGSRCKSNKACLGIRSKARVVIPVELSETNPDIFLILGIVFRRIMYFSILFPLLLKMFMGWYGLIVLRSV